VEYGTSQSYGKAARADTYKIEGLRLPDSKGQYTQPLKVYQQIVHLTGLKPGTRYYYRTVSKNGQVRQKSCQYFFKTAPKAGSAFKVLLLSDLQLLDRATETVKLGGQQDADIIIYNGDMLKTPYKGEEWFTIPGTPGADSLRWFNMMQQTAGGCKLLQYTPIYPSPGNHEVDIQEQLAYKSLAGKSKMSLSIYMQLFRPLYPEQKYYSDGKHWYSADYGNLHIVSLSIFRSFAWEAAEAPGWFLSKILVK
jgi:hypothetical protein